jgi:hypothetical protein
MSLVSCHLKCSFNCHIVITDYIELKITILECLLVIFLLHEISSKSVQEVFQLKDGQRVSPVLHCCHWSSCKRHSRMDFKNSLWRYTKLVVRMGPPCRMWGNMVMRFWILCSLDVSWQLEGVVVSVEEISCMDWITSILLVKTHP